MLVLTEIFGVIQQISLKILKFLAVSQYFKIRYVTFAKILKAALQVICGWTYEEKIVTEACL